MAAKPKIDPQKFDDACLQVRIEFKDTKYRLTGKNADNRVSIKPSYSVMIRKYFAGFEVLVDNTSYYPTEMVMRLSVILGIYVTDIARFKR